MEDERQSRRGEGDASAIKEEGNPDMEHSNQPKEVGVDRTGRRIGQQMCCKECNELETVQLLG